MIFKGLISRKKRRRSRRSRESGDRFYAREPRRRDVSRSRFYKYLLFLAGALVIGSGVYYFFFSESFVIKTLTVERDDAVVNSSIDEEFFSSLKGKNIFLLSRTDIDDLLSSYNYSVSDFRIRRAFPHTVRIELTGFRAIARTTWLGEEYFINEDGFLSPASDGSGVVLPYISLQLFSAKVEVVDNPSDFSFGDVFGLTHTDRVAHPEDLRRIILFLDRFREDYDSEVLEVEYFRVPHEIGLKTMSGTRILFDLKKSLEGQYYKLGLVAESLGFGDGRVSEIDLRIGDDRVFYSE